MERVVAVDSLVVTPIFEAVSMKMTNIFSSVDIKLCSSLTIFKLTLIHSLFH